MKQRYITFGVLASAISALADTRVVSKYTSDGKTSETAVLTKGAAQRFEYGKDAAVIQHCDRKSILQINLKNQTYTRISSGEAAATPAVAAPAEKKGGVVTVKYNITDTGERKTMFGHKARHIKSVMTRVPGEGACDQTKQRVEIDGWYIDLPQTAACSLADGPAAATKGPSCSDEIKYENTGNGEAGFPLSYTMTTYGADNKPTTMSMLVSELETKVLDASLFDVPAGFKEISLTSVVAHAAAPKVSGSVRVGVAPLRNKAQYGGNINALDERLLSNLQQKGVDAVLLTDGPGDALQASAKKLQCDYILHPDLAEVGRAGGEAQPAKGGRFGGLVRGVKALSGAQEASTARLDYRLEPAVGGQPLVTASANGKTGGFGLRNAMVLATTVGTIALQAQLFGPMSMMNPKMMNSMMGMNALGGGAKMGLDPSMMLMSAILQSTNAATAGLGGEPKNAQENAIAAAIQEMVKNVTTQVPAQRAAQ